MNNNTTFQQPFELVTQKFLSKIKYGELTVKFPSGSIKTFKGNDNNYKADLIINNYKFVSKILKRKSVGFAESYMDGDFSSSNLTNLLLLAFRNENDFDSSLLVDIGCYPISLSNLINSNPCNQGTVSISTPPSVEAIKTTRRVPRSTTAPRYNSSAISVQVSTKIFVTG